VQTVGQFYEICAVIDTSTKVEMKLSCFTEQPVLASSTSRKWHSNQKDAVGDQFKPSLSIPLICVPSGHFNRPGCDFIPVFIFLRMISSGKVKQI